MDEIRKTVVWQRITTIEGKPKTSGSYFTNLGKIEYSHSSGWTVGAVPCNSVQWFLQPRTGIFISLDDLRNCEEDYLMIPTKDKILHDPLQ